MTIKHNILSMAATALGVALGACGGGAATMPNRGAATQGSTGAEASCSGHRQGEASCSATRTQDEQRPNPPAQGNAASAGTEASCGSHSCSSSK